MESCPAEACLLDLLHKTQTNLRLRGLPCISQETWSRFDCFAASATCVVVSEAMQCWIDPNIFILESRSAGYLFNLADDLRLRPAPWTPRPWSEGSEPRPVPGEGVLLKNTPYGLQHNLEGEVGVLVGPAPAAPTERYAVVLKPCGTEVHVYRDQVRHIFASTTAHYFSEVLSTWLEVQRMQVNAGFPTVHSRCFAYLFAPPTEIVLRWLYELIATPMDKPTAFLDKEYGKFVSLRCPVSQVSQKWLGPSAVYCPACGKAQSARFRGQVAWKVISGGVVATYMCECKCFIQTTFTCNIAMADNATSTVHFPPRQPRWSSPASTWHYVLAQLAQVNNIRIAANKTAIPPDVFDMVRRVPLGLAHRLVGDLANAVADNRFTLESFKEKFISEISHYYTDLNMQREANFSIPIPRMQVGQETFDHIDGKLTMVVVCPITGEFVNVVLEQHGIGHWVGLSKYGQRQSWYSLTVMYSYQVDGDFCVITCTSLQD